MDPRPHPHSLPPSEGSQHAYAAHSNPHAPIYPVRPSHRPTPSQTRPYPPPPHLPHHHAHTQPYTYPAYLSTPPGPNHLRPHPHPAHPAHPVHHHPSLSQNTTCIPGLIPPGMNPSEVDMRSFFPYVPNEVKHRKRTTRAQLKVLEEMFKKETKPSATVRKVLSQKLGMTPREVQVWFQNRRAKVKNQAKKVAAMRDDASSAHTLRASESPSPPPPSPLTDARAETATEASQSRPHTERTASSWSAPSEVSEGSSGDTVTPDATAPDLDAGKGSDIVPSVPPLPTVNVAFTSPFGAISDDIGNDGSGEIEAGYYNSSGEYSPFQATPSQSLAPPAHDLLALRRGSLPNLPFGPAAAAAAPHLLDLFGQPFRTDALGAGNTYSTAPASAYDLQTRRASIATTDTHAMRLGTHPYAHLAVAANHGRASIRPGPTHSPSPALGLPHQNAPRRPGHVQRSVTVALGETTYHHHPLAVRDLSSLDVPPPVGGPYASSSRTVGPPPAGPLPEQGFSFGAPPPATGYDSQRGSVSSEPEEEREWEREREYRYVDWERVRGRERFGSVASVASYVSAASGVSEFGGAGGSESSRTSWYPSEEGGGGQKEGEAEGRRGSCASGHFLEMFSGLDVGNSAPAHHASQPQAHAFSNMSAHSSPGIPPSSDEIQSAGPVTGVSGMRRSSSSELAYALQAPEGQEGGADAKVTSSRVMSDVSLDNSQSQGPYDAQYNYQPPQNLTKGFAGGDFALYPDGYALDPYASYAQAQIRTGELSPIYEGGAVELSTVSGMHVCVPATGGLQYGFDAYGQEYQ